MAASPQVYTDSFYDVPGQRPSVRIALPAVRVHRQHIPLQVNEDLLGGTAQLMCEVEAEVSLAAHQRGIHMSRIEQAFQHDAPGPLADIALAIAERIRRTQEQERARVHLRALAPMRTSTPVTTLASPDAVEITATAVAGPRPSISQSVSATNMTACPCMQGYALTELVDELGLTADEGLRLLGRVPIATHSQKGRVTLSVRTATRAALPGLRLLYETVAAHTVLTQELLKRPDEYEIVRRTHLRPQFVEDVTRDTAAGLARRLLADGHDVGGVTVQVTADSYESIHGHDIQATVEAPADRLLGDV
ncbi:GTP cyclohydrolase, FolE2/MptA family [Nonomuraea solani]|uniref:GTP cyclohydrolase, FolE2/MptA family n=1 Tax=Nonomuraea solani TaxID=1144553 RepID=UPI00135BF93E|nr:GTP cyclohydrolase, FolE2/MptA family [Nonomuraea solani]